MNVATILKILGVLGANIPTLITLVEQLVDANKSSTGPTDSQMSSADTLADQASANVDQAADKATN
ncbi:hypothetical protein HK22_02100 [Gluconobacter sp. DsW_056]|uniref:hypothetical protein n=1 Tax=Gluconobacter sp. DsW_056 TaxID=1511209 RepID=UPI000A37981A|nr:hypothetical protein [Gluconobacter sp. DsW_056]OUI81671.1 hypothetical protein HK22_02100 [Gluconobacter sp. DsW_056]